VKPAILIGLILGYCLAPDVALGDGAARFPAGQCHFAPIAPNKVVTAKHCITGQRDVPLDEAFADWIILAQPHSMPPVEIGRFTPDELRGRPISFAGKQDCRISFPLGETAYILNCTAKPGDSGAGVYVSYGGRKLLVGVISGFINEGNAVVTSSINFPRGE
jgi:hypothetical protein